MATQAKAQARVRMYGIAIALAGGLLAGASATAATLFVDNTGAGGAYTTIEAAFTAAGANDTIYVRGGQTFTAGSIAWGTAKSGIKLYGGWNGSMATPLSNATISPNTAGNLAVANPARLAETIINGGSSLAIGGTAGDAVTGATIRGFDFQKSATAININGGSVASTISNLDLSNNRITISTGQGVNNQQASPGANTSNLLLQNNRVTIAGTASAKTAFYLGGSVTAYSTDVTVTGNYFLDQAASGGNNRAVSCEGLKNGVIANNVFDGLSAHNINNVYAGQNVVIAQNQILGSGKASTGMRLYPVGNTAGDQDLKNVLVSNNVITGQGTQSIVLSVAGNFGAGNFGGDDGVSNLWIRHNQITANAADQQARGGSAMVALPFLENTQGNGPVEVTNNDITIVGNRSDSGVGNLIGIQISGAAPTTATGGLAIRNNNITESSPTGTSLTHGIRINPDVDTNFGTPGAIAVDVTNNKMDGFLTSGVGVYTNATTGVVSNLPTGAAFNVSSNNFANLGANSVVQGTTGPNITGTGNYNAGATSGNVSLTSPAGSANTVAGRDANYVTFRGDHNLNNSVDAADAALIVSNFGARGPGVTYYKGDSTLDQEVTLADGKVFARFVHDPIGASGTITDPASAGAPTITYDPLTGKVTFTAGAQGSIWGLSLKDGLTVLTPGATTPANLGAGFLYGDVTSGIEFYNSSFGSTGAFASGSDVLFATLATGLTAPAFGQVEYFFGQDALVSSQFTPITFLPIPEPTGLVLLGLGAWSLVARRQRGR